MYDFLLVQYCKSMHLVPFSSYLTLNNIVTLKSGSEVTETYAIRKLGCGFIFAFYSNYDRMAVSVAIFCELFSVKV